jgi:DmsE family decaheme c-type cytochrome
LTGAPVWSEPSSTVSKSPSEGASAQPPSIATAAPAATVDYVGTQACLSCHEKTGSEIEQTMMGNILIKHPRNSAEEHGCEACHGPGSNYVQEMAVEMGKGILPDEPHHGPAVAGIISFRPETNESAEEDNAPCLNCHEREQQAFWRASTHAFRGVKCVDCHEVVRPTNSEHELKADFRANPFIYTCPETQVCLKCHLDKRNQMNMPSHMPLREGLMVCTDCHNPHGGPYPRQLIQPTVNEVCYTCHAEKRGPFLWVHAPVMQDCSNCHEPHGSTNHFLLKISPPRLCQQCHIGTFHPGTPSGRGTVFVFGHSCTNCHANIHGSNSPGGVFLTR